MTGSAGVNAVVASAKAGHDPFSDPGEPDLRPHCPTCNTRVIGLDISLTATGIASNTGWATHIGATRITALALPARIRAIDNLVNQICDMIGHPDLVVVEGISFGSGRLSGGVLERDALWWLVVRRLLGRTVGRTEVAVVPPALRAKYATGRGNGGKTEVVDQVARRYPQYQSRGNDNECDAIVLAAMGADYLGHPIASVPATHRAALDKVAWPAVFGD